MTRHFETLMGPVFFCPGQVKVPLKMGFFPFLVAESAIFWFLMLPLCLPSSSKENRKNPPNYGRPPDHGIHRIHNLVLFLCFLRHAALRHMTTGAPNIVRV
jgi:hypothetical protein